MVRQFIKHLLLNRVVIVILGVVLVFGIVACTSTDPTPEPTEAPAEEEAEAPEEEEAEAPAEEMEEEMRDATLAIEHFSVIEGTTWSGAHDRAGKRLRREPRESCPHEPGGGDDANEYFSDPVVMASFAVGNRRTAPEAMASP